MANCNWEEIEAFQSPLEFKRFVKWIEQQRDDGICREMENTGGPWADRTFVCNETGEVWVLRHPDPGYFAGSWTPLVNRADG